MKNAIVTGKVTVGGKDGQSQKIEFQLDWAGVTQDRADNFLNDFAKIRIQDLLRRTMTLADLRALPEGLAAGTKKYAVKMNDFFNNKTGQVVTANKAVEIIAASGDEVAMKAAIAALQEKLTTIAAAEKAAEKAAKK